MQFFLYICTLNKFTFLCMHLCNIVANLYASGNGYKIAILLLVLDSTFLVLLIAKRRRASLTISMSVYIYGCVTYVSHQPIRNTTEKN